MKELIYSLLDTLTFGKGIKKKINGFPIVFPTRWFRYFGSEYEPESFDLFKKYINQGDVILDIGAHIGLYSVFFSKLTQNNGRVYSFEPNNESYLVLKQTLHLNNCENVITFPMAVSSKTEDLIFYSTGSGDAFGSLVLRDNTNKIVLPAVSVDDFVEKQNLAKVNIIKIDVEGAELDALRGALKTFDKYKPIVLLALHPSTIRNNGHSLLQIYNILNDLKYDIRRNDMPINKDEFCEQTNLFDVFMIPHDK
jgi:FkbM family methyltransferase